MCMHSFVVIAAICLLVARPVWADFDDGMAAYERGDDETAVREWLPLAEQGDTRAQYYLGMTYYYGGNGVPQDIVQGLMWLNIAAAQGDPIAGVIQGMVSGSRPETPDQIVEAERLARDWMDAHQ